MRIQFLYENLICYESKGWAAKREGSGARAGDRKRFGAFYVRGTALAAELLWLRAEGSKGGGRLQIVASGGHKQSGGEG